MLLSMLLLPAQEMLQEMPQRGYSKTIVLAVKIYDCIHEYLSDMLSVDGDADATVEARIRIGWNKFRQSGS